MNRTEHDIGFLAADEPVHVVGCSLRLGLVVDAHDDDVAAAELAALLAEIKVEAIIDEIAELRVSAAERQPSRPL